VADRSRKKPIRDAEDMERVLQTPGALRDHLRRTEEALRSSEEYYRAVFQNTGTAMVVMEEDTTIVHANKESLRLVGYTPEELEGMKALDFVAPEDYEKVLSFRTARLADPENSPKSIEVTIVDRNGGRRDGYMTSEMLPCSRKIIASFLDITERTKMESALRESEKKYRSIFDNAVEGIFQIRPDGTLLAANPAFARILGYSSPEQVLSPAKNVFCEEAYVNPGRTPELKERLLSPGFVSDFEIECKRTDGSRYWVTANVMVVGDSGGSHPFYEGTIVDITERKRMQEDLESKSRSLEETNAALTVLLRRREQDNANLGEKVIRNVEDLVLPYVERLGTINPENAALANIIKSNLRTILAPFIRSMGLKCGAFTPKEIQIANLVRLGKTSKDICRILNLSTCTIHIHRTNIRRKLGITSSKVNLRSHLLSLDDDTGGENVGAADYLL